MKRIGFYYSGTPKETVPCPICEGTEFKLLASVDRYGMGVSTANCKVCGLVMTNPLPTQEAMDEFYEYQYRFIYGKPLVPTLEYIRELELERRASYTVDFLSERNLFAECNRVLDVGCGEGSILREIKIRKPHIAVVGIEPAEKTAEFAREYTGGEVHFSLLELIEGHGQTSFDLIIANHVLEHVRNPVQFLVDLKRILKPNASIYVDLPDVSAYTSLADLHIAHLYHFSIRTLIATAHRGGLNVAYIGRHAPPRHPRSIRCVLMLHSSELTLSEADLDDGNVCDLIITINDQGRPRYSHRSTLKRLVLGGFHKIRWFWPNG